VWVERINDADMEVAGLIGVAGLGAIAMLAVVGHPHSSVRPESAGIGTSMSPLKRVRSDNRDQRWRSARSV